MSKGVYPSKYVESMSKWYVLGSISGRICSRLVSGMSKEFRFEMSMSGFMSKVYVQMSMS